jgi:uncharacterized protein (DUF58 family)
MSSRTQRGLLALTVGGVRLTLRGWVFLAASFVCFIAAYAGGRHELLYAATLLAALPIIAFVVVWARRPKLSVVRSFSPHVIAAGNTASVTLAVRNVSPRRSLRARWTDTLPWRPGATEEGDLPALQVRGPRFAARNSVTLGYELTPPRRGIFPIGPMSIEVGDALGLAASSISTGEAQAVTVTPEVIPLAETGLTMPAGDGEARLVQRRATGDDDDSMTREYRTGDAMRRVHWRASARHGDLMVRQEEQRSFPEARIIVDTRRAGYRDVSNELSPGGSPARSPGGSGAQMDDTADSAAFEWVVRMLASVAVHLRRMGFLVTIEETALPQLDHVGQGRRRTWGDEEFLASLAAIGLADTLAARRTGGASDRTSRANGPVVAIVGTPEPDTVDWLLRQRRPGELAVVFMVRNATSLDVINRSFGVPSSAPAVAERLADAGWLVVPVREDDDHAAAWEAVVVETGRARGNG